MSKADYDALPSELRSYPHFVGYRLVERDGKRTKQPVDLRTGGLAKVNDSRTWVGFAEAVEAYGRLELPGIGFVFASGDPFTGIDLDNATRADGSLHPWALAIVDRFPGAYVEWSQSGTGLHLIVRAKAPHNGKTAYEGGAVEVYDRERFFVLTGRPFGGVA